MNPMLIIAGALIGLGLAVAIAELRPAPPRLDATLARLDATTADPASQDGYDGLVSTLGRWLNLRFGGPGGLPIPRRDLSLLGRSAEWFLLTKVGFFFLGLLLPGVAGLMFAAAGLALPWVLPAGVSLLAGVVMFFVPDIILRDSAKKRRADFRHATTSYLDLVALDRSAGAAPNEALESAARVGEGWAFRRITAVLDQSSRTQVPPWSGLARLGEDVGVSELTDLADIAELAGNEGAKILDTLMAKSESMRNRSLAEARAAANSRTTTMTIPVVLLGSGLILLLMFPQVYRMLSG